MPEVRSYEVEVVLKYRMSANSYAQVLEYVDSRIKPAIESETPGRIYPLILHNVSADTVRIERK